VPEKFEALTVHPVANRMPEKLRESRRNLE